VGSRKALYTEINGIGKRATMFREPGAQCAIVGKGIVSLPRDFLKYGEIAGAEIAL